MAVQGDTGLPGTHTLCSWLIDCLNPGAHMQTPKKQTPLSPQPIPLLHGYWGVVYEHLPHTSATDSAGRKHELNSVDTIWLVSNVRRGHN